MWNPFDTSAGADEQDQPEEAPFDLDEQDVPVRPEDVGGDIWAEHVLEALGEVIDPEIGLDIVNMGLVYAVDVDDETVRIAITATTPACPMSDAIRQDVRTATRKAVGAERDIEIYLVWEPRWSPEMMSDAARERLGTDSGASGGLW